MGLSILRIVHIDCYSNDAEVEIVKRKSSGSDIWNENENAEQFDDSIFEKIQLTLFQERHGFWLFEIVKH